MILVKNLSLKFTKEFYALYDVNLEIKKGEAVALLGEEHSGKTTLLRVLCKLEKDFTGEVYIKDIPLKKVDFSLDVNMGYIPAAPVFFEKKTVYQNLQALLKSRKINKSQREEKINKLLIEYNFEKFRDEKVKNLSLFEKYILSIARLSLREIELVLIDNIFEKLSQEEYEKICELIKKQFLQNKVTTVIATTSPSVAKDLTKRTIKFKLGSITE
ncbi:MAG: ATP-binding cassette domain-containing protein [Firmicutes bacterium]|nr:ATP-binding cassette domain-containing protein [Bacillota bacterium]MDY5586428.1 ATP-binding cassette domain-containing protein [Eubacteriales bacterium]